MAESKTWQIAEDVAMAVSEAEPHGLAMCGHGQLRGCVNCGAVAAYPIIERAIREAVYSLAMVHLRATTGGPACGPDCWVCNVIGQAVAAEREECAKLVERVLRGVVPGGNYARNSRSSWIVATQDAIRARGSDSGGGR